MKSLACEDRENSALKKTPALEQGTLTMTAHGERDTSKRGVMAKERERGIEEISNTETTLTKEILSFYNSYLKVCI